MILVKFPSRSRPERFLQVLQGWVDKAHDIYDIYWCFSFDLDDPSMVGIDSKMPHVNGIIHTGLSDSKVHAINRDIEKMTKPWDTLIVLSDDMVCVMDGWDDFIRKEATTGMFWSFDGHQKSICTLPIISREWYDRFAYVYNPVYISVFCDDEATAVARQNNELIFTEQMIARHEHPANGYGGKPDPLYKKNESAFIWKKDQETYFERKAKGFPE